MSITKKTDKKPSDGNNSNNGPRKPGNGGGQRFGNNNGPRQFGGGGNFGGSDRRGGGGSGPGKKRGDRKDRKGQNNQEPEAKLFVEEVIKINRCARVVAGGRRFSFSALVVCGDQKGTIGFGLGKASEVPDAIRKATQHAKKNMTKIILKGTTIPHDVIGEFDGSKVILRPACDGTGIIAGGAMRPLLKVLGVQNILTKSLRSSNSGAVVQATLKALKQLRSAEMIYEMRNHNNESNDSFVKHQKMAV